MKVCTDACLFGAFVANEIQSVKQDAIKNILDIGSGTGLLSLMLAQKLPAKIDTVEIDTSAFEQAKENIIQSLYREKIEIFNADIIQFSAGKKYDYIISNPPFFEADLKSGNEKKNVAKHNTTLTLQELLSNADRLLNTTGIFAVLLPYHRVEYFVAESLRMNFHLTNKLLVKQTPVHNFFRGILIFSRKESNVITAEITIKNAAGNYTDEFINLLKDYYLYL
jgi:tRNA1Val (adenine37-N6)-methyltransferase